MLRGRGQSESQRVELVRSRPDSVFDRDELAFANHVHDLDAGEQDACAAKGLEAEHRPGDAFDGAAVNTDSWAPTGPAATKARRAVHAQASLW